MLYISCWLFFFASFFLNKKFNLRRQYIFLSFIFFSLIACLRGEVGTDTLNYITIIERTSWASIASSPVEPTFVIFCLFIKTLVSNSTYVINVIALFFSVVCFFAYRNASSNLKFIYLIYLLPVFYFPYSMNIIRLGLAVVVFIFGFSLFINSQKRSKLSSSFFMLLGGSLHVSLLYLLFLFSIVYFCFFKVREFFYFLLVSVLLVAIGLGQMERKKELYFSDADEVETRLDYRFNSISGIINELFVIDTKSKPGQGRLIIAFILVLSTLSLSISQKNKVTLLGFGFFNLILINGLLSFSVAGLRLLDLFLFGFPCVVGFFYEKEFKFFGQKELILYTVISLLLVCFVVKDMYSSKKFSMSPFIPYKTIKI